MYETIVKDDGTISIIGCASADENIVIPDTINGCRVTEIGNYAFYKSFARSVTIPDSVVKIGVSAFDGCTLLRDVTIPDSVESIGESAFHNCRFLKSVIIPDSVTRIGNCAFEGCSDLKSVTISKSVKKIGDYAFFNCLSLKSVTIPESVKEIGHKAFDDCTTLLAEEQQSIVSEQPTIEPTELEFAEPIDFDYSFMDW